MMPRSPTAPGQPFVTRRSTLAFALAFMVSFVITGFIPQDAPGTGVVGAIIALIYATGLVSLVMAWMAGGVLAWRSRSLLWLVISFLPPPFGAVPCALFAPGPGRPGSVPPGRTPTRGPRP